MTDKCVVCGGAITHVQIGTLLNGELIHADPRCQNLVRLLKACNWILADAKVSLDYADQVLVAREIIGELRNALRDMTFEPTAAIWKAEPEAGATPLTRL